MFAEIVQVLRKKQYNILGEIGYGAFGMVYHLKNQNGEDRAVKCVSKQDARNQQEEEFINNALMGSTHPNIITIKEVFREPANGGDLCIIMEFCDGGNLDQHRYEFNPYQLFELMRDVLKGLNFMHRKQIVHRDLKPSNILLKREQGRIVAKLCDFGVSRLFERDDFMLSVVGTYPYMAPQYEIGRGYDRGVDIWAFGAVFYEIITGENPFAKEGCDKLAVGKNLPVLRELFTKIFTSNQHRITDEQLLNQVFSRQLKPEWAKEIEQAQRQAKERHHKKPAEQNPPEPLEQSGIIIQREQHHEVVMRQESPEAGYSPARMPNPVATLPQQRIEVLTPPQILSTHQPIRRAETHTLNPIGLKPPKVRTPRRQDPSSQASDQEEHSDINQMYTVRRSCKDCNDFMDTIKFLKKEAEMLRPYKIDAQKRQGGGKQFPAEGSAEEIAALSKLVQQNQEQKNRISKYEDWVKQARFSYDQLRQEKQKLEVRLKEAEPLLQERESMKSQLSECQDLLVNANRNYWSLVQSWLDEWRYKTIQLDMPLKSTPVEVERLLKTQRELEEQWKREREEWKQEKESLLSEKDEWDHKKGLFQTERTNREQQFQAIKKKLEKQIADLQYKLNEGTSHLVKGYETKLAEMEKKQKDLKQEFRHQAAKLEKMSEQLASEKEKYRHKLMECIKAQQEAKKYKDYLDQVSQNKNSQESSILTSQTQDTSESKVQQPNSENQAEKRFREKLP